LIPVLLFPQFSPTIVEFGPFALGGYELGPFGIRWYAMAYILGLVLGWRIMRRLVRLSPAVAEPLQVDDFLTWATVGVVLGGRLGYVLFYQPAFYLANPGKALEVWHGGMSFHGGFLGVTVATVWFCRKYAIPLLGFADRLAVVTPLGLMLGRIANFINGELWGRPAPDWLPWAMVFPTGGNAPRHPSQLYQAAMEGLVLFAVLFALSRRESIRAHFGTLTGVFLIGYGLARIIGEFFRQPDAFLGFLLAGATMGQLLSLPMVAAGIWLVLHARRHVHA
jgi:phosphatidylglycerol---prolipoprotein diacylglyceryl transferase